MAKGSGNTRSSGSSKASVPSARFKIDAISKVDGYKVVEMRQVK